MPQVTDDFVKCAKMLSEGVPALLDQIEKHKKAETEKAAEVNVRAQVDVVADTLIAQGLVKATEKAAAVKQLSDHREALNILNRTAQQVAAQSMGHAPAHEKASSDESDVRESDRLLLNRLGFAS